MAAAAAVTSTSVPLGVSSQAKGDGAHSDIDYTDVVIIGNGPSGLSLSYMLGGHAPYYTGTAHSDEYLTNRLHDEDKGTSLYEQDLDYLSSGLEGRSSNPVALLFDCLSRPDADLGEDQPSLLDWRKQAEYVIPHVVLGRGKAGGVWQTLEGKVETLSLGNWMSLPNIAFNRWLDGHRGTTSNTSDPVPFNRDRASFDEVRVYYENYVKANDLDSYFRYNTHVTDVERVLDVCHTIDSESGEQLPCSHTHTGKHKWEVRGYEVLEDDVTGTPLTRSFCYRTPHVVLAVGSTGVPHSLRVPGETNQPYVLHTLQELESRICSGVVSASSEPVLVVGAGLSAADAIICCRARGVPVIHVFRRSADDPGVVYRNLPSVVYPEYRSVHEWMQTGTDGTDGYRSYPEHSIQQCGVDGAVLLCGINTREKVLVQVSAMLVQIGARPDLSFMPRAGRNLGSIPDCYIDSRHNPIAVDQFSHQCHNEAGLFAMGPVVGDNFVRFLQGGALAITNHLWKKTNGKL